MFTMAYLSQPLGKGEARVYRGSSDPTWRYPATLPCLPLPYPTPKRVFNPSHPTLPPCATLPPPPPSRICRSYLSQPPSTSNPLEVCDPAPGASINPHPEHPIANKHNQRRKKRPFASTHLYATPISYPTQKPPPATDRQWVSWRWRCGFRAPRCRVDDSG